jgi:hypothetical protein
LVTDFVVANTSVGEVKNDVVESAVVVETGEADLVY